MRDDKDPIDLPTLLAGAIIVYALANVAHEGLGHGGACVLVGGVPLELNATYFDCDESRLGVAGVRAVAAGGTIVNLVIGALAWLGLRRSAGLSVGRYFLWLLMSVSLFQGTGYWLFSGLGNVGDWSVVIDGLAPAWVFRAGLAIVGGVAYTLTVGLSMRTLRPFIGEGEGRDGRARKLTLLPYLIGGALYVTAGTLNPIDPMLVLISGAAASFGGTSALAWMHRVVRRLPAEGGDARGLVVPRSVPLIAAGALVAAVFIGILGRTVRLGAPLPALPTATSATVAAIPAAPPPAPAPTATAAPEVGPRGKILCFGDSITQADWPGKIAPEEKWVTQLGRKSDRITAVNAGKNGRTTTEGLAELGKALDDNADSATVLFFLGVNDMKHGHTGVIDTATANLGKMVDLTRQRLPGVDIVITAPIIINVDRLTPYFKSEDLGPDTVHYMKALAVAYEVLARKKGARFINLLDVVSPANLEDGIHANGKGQGQIADAVWKGLTR